MHRNQLFAYSLVLGLTACGGGSGGGSSGGGSSGSAGSTRSPVPPQTAITYSGATTPATISATSAGTLVSSVVGSNGAALGGNTLTGVSVQADSSASAPQPTGATGFARRLAKAIHSDELGRARNGAVAGAAINQSIACDSGTININGTVNDSTGAGTASVDFVDCRTGSDTLNGPAAMRIDSYDQSNKVITDGTMTFTRVRFTGPGANFDLTGTLRTQVSLGNNTETQTSNVVTQDNVTGHQTRVSGLTFNNVYSNVQSPTFFTQSINGDVCDGTAGCVNVSTQTAPHTSPWGPLYFATSVQDFPDWGIINLAAGAGRVRITSLGVDLAKVEVDAAGDGIYENSARMRWSELSSNLAADLGDNDGDGMHNSWESAKGLNPNANDAAADNDNDGASNLTEYLAGSDPSTNGSQPSGQRHLWVTDVSDLAFDPATGQINAFIGGSATSGALVDPVTGEIGADFSSATVVGSGSGTRTIVDAAGRSYTLAPTASPTAWLLTSSNGASVTVNNVAGTDAGSLTRYPGGLAFRTVGTASPGYIYLINFP